jgi:hypothetical protein
MRPITDAQWVLVAPLIPEAEPGGRVGSQNPGRGSLRLFNDKKDLKANLPSVSFKSGS